MLRNDTGVSLLMAVWLAANNGYDLVPAPNLISATSLLDPIKCTVLTKRVDASKVTTTSAMGDVMDSLPSKVGTAVHTSVETAWLTSHKQALLTLGYPEEVVNNFKVNPAPGEEAEHNVYLELRTNKDLDGWVVSGKFDAVVFGQLCDVKNTKVYTYIKGTNNEKWAMQGSIYRWLRPDIITEDTVQIEYVFNDWDEYKVKSTANYPPRKVMSVRLPLTSIVETEIWIKNRIKELVQALPLSQDQLPTCTKRETWQDSSVFAYYKKAGAAKATKLFDNSAEAHARKTADGGTGTVTERKAVPKFCNYCNGRSICKQREGYVAQGLLN